MKKFLFILLIFSIKIISATPQENIQLLDSIVSFNYYENGDSTLWFKIENEYDGLNQMTSHSIYEWSKVNGWTGSVFPCEECYLNPGRYEYVYDDLGNQIWRGGYDWSERAGGWVLQSQIDMIYDDLGNNISYTFNMWIYEEEIWSPYTRFEYEFDDSGLVISSLASIWHRSLLFWIPKEKNLFYYDSRGSKIKEIKLDWVDSLSPWDNVRKIEWFYTADGIKKEIVTSLWKGSENKWKESQRHRFEYEYDTSGNCTLLTELRRVNATSWSPIYQKEVTYNDIGFPIMEIIREGSPILRETILTEWIYDLDGHLKKEIVSGNMYRIGEGLELLDRLKVIRSFDPYGNKTIELWHRWDLDTESYIFDSQDFYFYHSSTMGIMEPIIDHIKIFPNPTTGIINITGLTQPAQVKVYSIQGQLLKSELQVENTIDISDLQAGVYFLNLYVGNTIVRKTVISR